MLTLCLQSPIVMLPLQSVESGTIACTVGIHMENDHEGWKESSEYKQEPILVT